MITENIVKFPNELTRLFEDAHRAVAMGQESKEKFVEGKLLLSSSLAAIRTRFKDNEAFGKSCAEHGLGENIINKNDRAYLIQWAERPEWTRTVLEKTERTSVRYIHEKEWLETLPHTGKSPLAPGGKAFEPIANFIRAEEARTGELPKENDITRATGASSSTVHTVSAVFRALRANADSTAPIRFTKADHYHVEALAKARMRELEKEFEARVIAKNQEEIAKLFPDLEELQKAAVLNERYYREMVAKEAVLTLQEWHDLVFLAHNKEVSEERKKRAAQTLITNKLRLTGER